MANNFLTLDFGKTSIRTILGVYSDRKLTMHEINRIPTTPLSLDDHTYLDVGVFLQTIISGMVQAAKEFGPITSLGIGFWGGVFALLNKEGKAIRYPFHYSDKTFANNRGLLGTLCPEEKIFTEFEGGGTFGSISMLVAIRKGFPEEFAKAKSLLMMPDYLAYLLTGNIDCDNTVLSSGGLSDVHKQWNMKAFQYLNLPLHIFTDQIVSPGKRYPMLPVFGALHPNLAATEYVRVASHDTASAVSTIPLKEGSAFISSGSTSIMGVITDEPVISKKAYDNRLLNEVTADGRLRLLRNIHGMTIQNNCISHWEKHGIKISFDEIDKEIMKIQSLKFMIDPNNSLFSTNDNLPEVISQYCRDTNQPVPLTPAEILTAIDTGLAMEYRNTIESLEVVTGKKIDTIYIVGGGLANSPLCQFTANVTGCTVITGNKEATSVGNLLMQAKAFELFTEYDDIAAITAESYPEKFTYLPQDMQVWEEAYKRYLVLLNK